MSYANYFSYVVCPANCNLEFFSSLEDRIIIPTMTMEYENGIIEHYNDPNSVIKDTVESKFQATDPQVCIEFLECHYDYYIKDYSNGEYFLMFVEELLQTIELQEKRKSNIQQWIETKRKEMNPNPTDQVTGKPIQAGEKIKWKGTPSQFGYLFLELVKHGFIDPPLYNGETNHTGLARLCYEYFDIDTTPGNLTKELKPDNKITGERKNTLSDTKRAKFTIPYLSDLA